MDVPAGWYPDPASPSSARWWDGSRWTEHTTPVDRLVPGHSTVIMPTAPAPPVAAAITVPTAPPELPAGSSPVPGFSVGTTDTVAYPLDPLDSPYAAPVAEQHHRPTVSGPLLAVIGVATLLLVISAGLAVHWLTSHSAPAAGGGVPPVPTAPAPSAPGSAAPSPSGSGGAATAGPADAARAAAVLETFKPTAADLPPGVEATPIDKGDQVAGTKTLDGWCSDSYASETDRVARRQWDLTIAGQSVGISIEVVAYGTPEQAAAALAEFTARTRACTGVTLTEDGTRLTQDRVSSEPLTGLPAGITGYHGVVSVSGTSSSGSPFTGTSTGTMQRKGRYVSIVWTNQSTPMSASDQQVVDRFVAQQTDALAATS